MQNSVNSREILYRFDLASPVKSGTRVECCKKGEASRAGYIRFWRSQGMGGDCEREVNWACKQNKWMIFHKICFCESRRLILRVGGEWLDMRFGLWHSPPLIF